MQRAASWLSAALFTLALGSSICYLEINALRMVTGKMDRYRTINSQQNLVLSDPKNTTYWQDLRVTYLEYGATTEGREWLANLALKKGPAQAEAYYSIAWLYDHEDESKQALSYYKKAIQINPVHDRAMINAALICRLQGDLEGSRSLTYSAVLAKPDHARWWYNLGVVNHEMDYLDEAKEAYLKAHELDPGDGDTLFNLALVYEEQKDLQAAFETYDRLTRFCPSYIGGWVRLGAHLQRMNRFNDAVESYNNALAVRKRYFSQEESEQLAEATTNLARSYHKLGEMSRAVVALEAGTSRFPNNVSLWIELGKDYCEQKNFHEALTAFTKAIEIDPQDRTAWQGKSEVCAKLGMKDQEKEANQKLVALGVTL